MESKEKLTEQKQPVIIEADIEILSKKIKEDQYLYQLLALFKETLSIANGEIRLNLSDY